MSKVIPIKAKTDKIIVLGGSALYLSLFDTLGTPVCNYNPSEEDVKGAMLVVFTGGFDVDPAMYGEEEHHSTNAGLSRDLEEAQVFQWCRDHDVPMVGICRGAQFLTVMAGGKLIQNVGGHLGDHLVTIRTPNCLEKSFKVNSTHHQMMYPFNLGDNFFRILGWSTGVGKIFDGFPAIEEDLKIFSKSVQGNYPREPEIVFYPLLTGLAIQFHPETMAKSGAVVKMVRQMIAYHLMKKYTTYTHYE